MLKFFMHSYFNDHIYTSEKELCYKIYKWKCGLPVLLDLRKIIGALFFWGISLEWLFLIEFGVMVFAFFAIGVVLLVLHITESKKQTKFNAVGLRTPAQIRAIRMEEFIRKFVSINGRALGKKEWKAIKEKDIELYNELLCSQCNHICYYYSLEIARIVKDSILIWGALEEPFEEGQKYYAHAVILRNGYIYDSNNRGSVKYEDFIKLYKFKTYKQWDYTQYSRKDFRESERGAFRKWCEENNVLKYEKF